MKNAKTPLIHIPVRVKIPRTTQLVSAILIPDDVGWVNNVVFWELLVPVGR